MLEALRRNITWRAIPFAGIAAGTVYLIVSALALPLFYGVDGSLIFRYSASLVMGSRILTDHSFVYVLVGLVVHYALSIFFALVIAIVIHRWGLAVGIIGGAILGLAIYSIDLYFMTRVFDWFFAINNPALVIAHILFGAIAGGVYESFDHYDMPLVGERAS